MTAAASSSAYQDVLGWELALAKAAAYTWGLGLALAVLGGIFRSGLSGNCTRSLLRLLRKYVWPSPYAQSQRDERIRLVRESRDAVRRTWRGGRT
eukprot:501038-Alexandrium_andersonii.AAC.1